MHAVSRLPNSYLLNAPQWLLAAPHRPLFAVGAGNILLAMVWWALWLADMRWHGLGLPASPLYPGFAHALITPYLVLGPFIFGFLLTVFPRWMEVPTFGPWHYLPVASNLIGAQLLLLLGQFAGAQFIHVGLLLALAGWSAGCAFLFDRLRRDRSRCWHARSAFAALLLGWLGLIAVLRFQWSGDAQALQVAIKLGVFGLLLPIYFTVCHRMFPFFAQVVVPGYAMWRPLPALALFWGLSLSHLALEMLGRNAWLWGVDLPMVALTSVLLWHWWPRGAAPAILRVLFIGLLWLPLGFALYAAQSLTLCFTDTMILGRAPLHALTVGYFGSLLVAMATRVTKGHSGRPLAMTAIDHFSFSAIQGVALIRVLAEIVGDYWAWNAIAAAAWVLAFLPWIAHSLWIWSTPRVDGKPG